MSSILGFAWKNRRPTSGPMESSSEYIMEEPSSPTPEVLASTSEETLDENFIQLQIHRVPQTPEGLRPRPSVLSLQKELNIPSTTTMVSPGPHITRPVLPSMPSCSWSTQGIMSSPPVSQNSFYHGDRVAKSPHLFPGKARTAVGALVALQQFPQDPELASVTSSLPPMPDEVDHNDNNSDWEQGGVGEPTPYVPLEDPIQSSRSPPRATTGSKIPQSPTATSSCHSSLVASPSSLARPYPLVKSDALAPYDQDETMSSSSRVGLIPDDPHEQYDFEPLVSNRMVIASDQTQVSGLGSHYSRVVSEDDGDVKEEEEMEQALVERKHDNQARFKQNLIVACLERLQDQVDLVLDIENFNEAGLQSFSKTSLDQEGLLTGFSADKRNTIVRNLNAILNEIEVAAPEEFLLSPTQIKTQTHNTLRDALFFCRTLVAMAIPASERQEANASHTPVDQQGYWRVLPHLTKALGTSQNNPETPVNRGGGTSVFSLPSEDTPMTSNVSISSTITSHHMNSHTKMPNVNGLYVRQTIQMLANSLQSLSSACTDLCIDDHVTAVHASEAIKRVYVKELLTMDAADLKNLIDGFELELPVFTKHGLVNAYNGPAFSHDYVRETCDMTTHCSSNDFSPKDKLTGASCISPHSADMETLKGGDDFDDLRRSVGSSDYDDGPETREGPPGTYHCSSIDEELPIV